MSSSSGVAYLAEGKLFLLRGSGEAEEIQSHFVQEIESRAERNRERNGWKQQSTGWSMTSRGLGAPEFLARMHGLNGAQGKSVRFTALSKSEVGKWFYGLSIDGVGGLFEYEERDQSERRVIHKVGLHITHISRRESDGLLGLTLGKEGGTAHLATMDPNGRGVKELTEGDCVDEAPSWVPGQNALVYQTAGVARNQQGMLAGYSPYAIHKVHLDSGKIETLWEDPKVDFLSPRVGADGQLYCIRRPYQVVKRVSFWAVLLDVLMMPFSLAFAIFGFLIIFSQIFGKKPLMRAGGPEQPGVDARWLMLYGRMVQVKPEAMANGSALVPNSWELVRKQVGSDECTVLARGVLSFDISPDGSVVFTNGSVLKRVGVDGEVRDVGKGKLVETVRSE